MKNIITSKTILVLLFLCIRFFSKAQTEVKVSFIGGSDQIYSVTGTGKLYFSGSELLIKTDASASDITLPISTIRKIVFINTNTTSVLTSESSVNVILYPNPSSESIIIKSEKKEKLSVAIYTINGQLLKEGNYYSDESIDITALTQGAYLITVNGITFKFIKK